MTLRRYIPVKDGLEDAGVRMARFDDGAWVRAADVDALLARIREAVEAERAAERGAHQCDCPFGWCDGSCPAMKARKALDALLADGGA